MQSICAECCLLSEARANSLSVQILTTAKYLFKNNQIFRFLDLTSHSVFTSHHFNHGWAGALVTKIFEHLSVRL